MANKKKKRITFVSSIRIGQVKKLLEEIGKEPIKVILPKKYVRDLYITSVEKEEEK